MTDDTTITMSIRLPEWLWRDLQQRLHTLRMDGKRTPANTYICEAIALRLTDIPVLDRTVG